MSAANHTYSYRATVLAVVDGDTIDCRVDLGFHLAATLRFRLANYNAPEASGAEASEGRRATAMLRELLAGLDVTLHTHKSDAFGRWLAAVELDDRSDLVTYLVARGWGVRWDGRGARPAPWRTVPYPLEATP